MRFRRESLIQSRRIRSSPHSASSERRPVSRRDGWRDLGEFYPTCAYSDEVIHIFLARDLSYGERSTDEDEFLSVEMVPLAEVKDMIMRGEIPDGKTQAAVLRVWLMQ